MEAQKKRGRKIPDPEIAAYARQIGSKAYHEQYCHLVQQARTKKTYSGKESHRSKEEISAIKNKYRNGVTMEHIKEMVGL